MRSLYLAIVLGTVGLSGEARPQEVIDVSKDTRSWNMKAPVLGSPTPRPLSGPVAPEFQSVIDRVGQLLRTIPSSTLSTRRPAFGGLGDPRQAGWRLEPLIEVPNPAEKAPRSTEVPHSKTEISVGEFESDEEVLPNIAAHVITLPVYQPGVVRGDFGLACYGVGGRHRLACAVGPFFLFVNSGDVDWSWTMARLVAEVLQAELTHRPWPAKPDRSRAESFSREPREIRVSAYRRAIEQGAYEPVSGYRLTRVGALRRAALEGLDEFQPSIEANWTALNRLGDAISVHESSTLACLLQLRSGAADVDEAERRQLERTKSRLADCHAKDWALALDRGAKDACARNPNGENCEALLESARELGAARPQEPKGSGR